MSDKESNNEIQIISERLQTVATLEYNNTQQQQGKSTRKNNNSVDIKTISDNATITTTENIFVRNVPELNLPEKILLVIDTVKEQQCTPFKLGTGATYSPLFMIKRVVENFVCAKSTIQPGVHQYALMSLEAMDTCWLCDYTSNIKTVFNYLEGIEENTLDEEQKTYDLGNLFETIHGRIAIPSKHQPAFVSRVILIYGRSSSVPKFYTRQKYLENLTENPYFFLDVLFVHEPPGDDDICEKVYAEIAALDTMGFSYIFEVGRNAAKIHDNMAKLLAHPLQRPLQKDASYTYTPLDVKHS